MSDLIERYTAKIVGVSSPLVRQKLEEIVKKKQLPMSTLVAIALEYELQKEKPFDYDVSAPTQKYIDGAYYEEAQKIVNFMRKIYGSSLEMMFILRADMGIPDKDIFNLAFREAMVSEMLEVYHPKQPQNSTVKYNEDVVFYRVKGASTKKATEARKKANEYEKFQKLKKKFEGM